MGSCFLRLIKEQPQYEWGYDKLSEKTLEQGYGSALDNTWACFPKHMRLKFPMLGKVDFQSGFYHDENLILSPEEVKQLKEEFRKFMDILNYKIFEQGLDAKQLKQYLQNGYSGFEDEWFEEQRRVTFDLLNKAVIENAWILIER